MLVSLKQDTEDPYINEKSNYLISKEFGEKQGLHKEQFRRRRSIIAISSKCYYAAKGLKKREIR